MVFLHSQRKVTMAQDLCEYLCILTNVIKEKGYQLESNGGMRGVQRGVHGRERQREEVIKFY